MNLSKTSQSTSGGIKIHFGVKTCRVAETRARQFPHKWDIVTLPCHPAGMGQELHCHLCVWKEFSHLVCHMSHPWLFSHAHSSMSSSSSSQTYPTTQREHSVHPAHLQAPSVDKLRHQESLWREDLRSGGNLRTTTPTGYEPKELATVSRIEAYSGDPYQLYDAQRECGERDHRALITEEVEEFREIGTHSLPDSQVSETSHYQSHMQFDDSAESIAFSDLEDGGLQKMLTYCWRKYWRLLERG